MLRALALRSGGFRMVSCPSCGRVQIDLNRVANEIEEGLKLINHENITYAVMGCVVNGPGEAKDADLGVAGGAGEGLIYRKGELIRKVKEEDLVPAFLEEARKVKAEADAAKA
jgi:(E)-4-hydroxy-3-methylbut-2-enyl-diphosphate synthase